jgi:hypothetical protein
MGQRLLVEMARRRARPGTGSSLTFLKERTAEIRWPRIDLDLSPVLCAIVGAVATRHYMPERRTQDIDVVVHKPDFDRAQRQLDLAGYEPRGRWAIGGPTWNAPSGQAIDLIVGEDPWWPDAIHQAQRNRDLQGLPGLPIEYLVLMRLRSSRAQDLADISRMIGQADQQAVDETLAVVERYAPKDVPDLQSLIELGRLELQEP